MNFNLHQSDAIATTARWNVERAAQAPVAEYKWWLARASMLSSLERHTPQNAWLAWNGCDLQPDDANPDAGLNDLPAINVGVAGTADEQTVKIKIRAELFYRGSPKAVVDRCRNAKRIELHLDSGGGCITWVRDFAKLVLPLEIPIVAYARRAYSAAALLLQFADKRYIHADGQVMVHAARICGIWTTAQLLETAKRMQAFDEITVQILSERTKQPEAVVRTWLSGESGDVYFSATEALSAGLVDEIISA